MLAHRVSQFIEEFEGHGVIKGRLQTCLQLLSQIVCFFPLFKKKVQVDQLQVNFVERESDAFSDVPRLRSATDTSLLVFQL